MDIIQITKSQAVAAYAGNTAALARALNITPSAIYQWPDGPIAEGYALKLQFVLKPDVFGSGADQVRQPPAANEALAAEAAPTVPMKRVA